MKYFIFVMVCVAKACCYWLGECGNQTTKPELEPQQRIVNGNEAKLHSWPWMARILDRNTDEPICMATIIGEQWALTAAHCLWGKSAFTVKLEVGRSDLRIEVGQELRAKHVVRHMHYNDKTRVNDIALVRTYEKMNFSATVQPACLPSSILQIKDGEECYATGWGNTKGTGDASKLQQIMLPLWSPTKCMYETSWGLQAAVHGRVCAGGVLGEDGMCVGDQGAPLNCIAGRLKQWTVVGVLSGVADETCQQPGYPDMFTRVSEYRDWISHVINYYDNKL